MKPIGSIARDGCLLVRRQERLQAARTRWLAAGAREVPLVWQPLADDLGKASGISAPALLVAGDALVLAGARLDATVRYRVSGDGGNAVAPPAWSREWETYCLRPLDDGTVRELDRKVDEIAACVAGHGVERLVHPRIESPAGRQLHSLSMAETRYCGVDQAGEITCCGVRAGVPPRGPFASVSIDGNYACAIRATGELACWGEAALGGRPPTGRFSRVDVGHGGACALTDRRAVRCWGVPPAWQAPADELADIAVATDYAVAATADGTIVEWGARSDRRAIGAVRVAAGECQACAITRTGTAECRDQTGQRTYDAGPLAAFAPACQGGCGLRPDGSVTCRGAGPLAQPAALADQRFTEIASTGDRVCATARDGHVECWGAPWPGPSLGRRLLTGAQP